jgi:hypothetical protein
MVTLAQRLEARIAALADKMNPSSVIRYEVELVWIQPDGSVPDRDDNPVVRRPGAAAIDTDNQPITVVVFSDGTREFALQRHRELRPDHAGRPGRFKHRNEPRTEVAEMFAIHTPDELKAVLDRIETKGRGKPIGEQVFADAHG